MKIVHICLTGPYTDNYAYQDNLLTKYHVKMGLSVEIITTQFMFDDSGKEVLYNGKSSYYNEFGVLINRLFYKKPLWFYYKTRRFIGLSESLKKAEPDVLFIHGLQFLDIKLIVKYLKANPHVIVFVDNHADFNNSAQNILSKYILHKVIWKHCAKMIEPFTTKFYGVLPARVDFLKEAYGLPADKCELLVMGADDESVDAAKKPEVRKRMQEEYGVTDNDFVIVTGGKIDHNKSQVLKLIKAVNEMADDRIRLIVFGSVSPTSKEEFCCGIGKYVKYVGWRMPQDIYFDFAVADLVVFPGLHSVLWEQAVGMGKPCIFKRIKGFDHVDLKGNCLFFEKDEEEEYKRVILKAVQSIDSMRIVAEGIGKETFSYKAIAKKALED